MTHSRPSRLPAGRRSAGTGLRARSSLSQLLLVPCGKQLIREGLITATDHRALGLRVQSWPAGRADWHRCYLHHPRRDTGRKPA
jgi:hypothetical protein